MEWQVSAYQYFECQSFCAMAAAMKRYKPIPADGGNFHGLARILLKNRSTKLRARYKCGLKQIASFRFRRGGMLAQAPCRKTNALIQSASYPRSAKSRALDFRRDKSLAARPV